MGDRSKPGAGDFRGPPTLDLQLESFLGGEEMQAEANEGDGSQGEITQQPPLRTPTPGWHGEPNRSICLLGGQN